MLIGEKVRILRDERHLSQEQLAKKVGIDRSTIAAYESENRLPSLRSLIRLSYALGVTTDYLLDISSDRTYFLDVSGLTSKQIASLDLIVENYRECNGADGEENET